MRDSDKQLQPPWWMRNAHLQTCFAPLWAPKLPNLHWEELATSDGDFLDICWSGDPNSETVLTILPGLEGSVQSHYVRTLMQMAQTAGWQVAVLHYRGCSGRINRLPRTYHAAETGDTAHFFSYVQHRRPNARLFAVGCSLGGILLTKTLRQFAWLKVERAAAISIPFDLQQSLVNTNVLYIKRFLFSFKSKLLDKLAAGQDLPINASQVKEIASFQDFDNAITAPIFGFSDAEHYYRVGSCKDDIRHIKIPMLLLVAEDDPLVPVESFPDPETLPEQVKLQTCATGGHLGFVASNRGSIKPSSDWLGQVVLDFLDPK